MILGPFSGLVLICFEPMTALKSMAFLPQGTLTMSVIFGFQCMTWFGFVGSVGVAIYDRQLASEDPNHLALDLYPLYVSTILILIRCSIVAVRYASSPVS